MASSPRASGKRQHYDCVFIGAQLAGVLAAALLAKRGHRVLVLDHDGLGDGYLDAGYLLPYSPALIPPLKSLPIAEAAFGELGMLTDLGRLLVPHEPELQVLLPEHRFDLSRDPALRLRELSREFQDGPAAVQAWASTSAPAALAEAFLAKPGTPFPAVGFWQRWKLKRRAAAVPEMTQALASAEPSGHALLGVARALAPFASYLEQEPASGLAVSRALALLVQGPQRLAGGVEGLRGLLQKRIKELGGDVLTGDKQAVVEELELKGSRISGVHLVSGEANYLGRAVIAATDASGLRALLPPQARKKHIAEQLDAVRLRRFMLAVNLVVPEEHVPLGWAALGLLEGGDELGPILYEVSPATRPNSKEKSTDRVICGGALVPVQTLELGDAAMDATAQRIRDAMLAVLPFAKPKLVSVPMLSKGTARGARVSPHPRLEVDETAQLGVTGLSPRTALKNLFLASREVIPGLGFEGELLAGATVADRVQAVLKKKDPLSEE